MPELPEVETTRRGIAPLVRGRRVAALVVRQARLRWPVPGALGRRLQGQTVLDVRRRAKYLLLDTTGGSALIHLGMSGSLRVVAHDTPPGPHDHVDLVLDDGEALRLRDPRRFGALLWCGADPERHPLLARLGAEPLDAGFDGACLHRAASGRRAPVKALLMDARVVVGVGNIYASEALFEAGIHPHRPARRIARARYDRLAQAVRMTLERAIRAGGTTLRDFRQADGSPGYFRHRLAVYGRQGQPCPRCGEALRRSVIAQRSTFYCPRCQR